MINLILAAGEHTIWRGQRAKQLAPIASEVLLKRTQRQAGNCITVTHLPAIHQQAQRIFIPSRRRWAVETALSTLPLWESRTNILLGDVCYSDDLMDRILSCDQPVAVYGCKRRWKMFALSFDKDAQLEVAGALETAILDADTQGGRGKLWEFYRAFCGLPLREEQSLEDQIFTIVDDYTDDFDTIEEYFDFLRANRWATRGNPPCPLVAIETLGGME